MDALLHDWLNLLVRWAHLIFGISWIGSSFYFMWLDRTLEPPDPPDERVTGKLWMVHSGGFYEVEKRKIGPGEMPARLHWFKWEAAFTWITGVTLLAIVYYLGGGIYLVDPAVSSITPRAALALCVGLLVGGWVVYDVLCNAVGRRSPGALAIVGFALVAATAYGLSQTLSGRAAYIHVGALLGTLMVGNVWLRILPAQRQMIEATARGERPDYSLGERAKLRSVHNNYMTFPVLFIMLSNHFPHTYGHPHGWAVLVGIMAVGALVRHVLNIEHRARALLLVPAAALLAGLFVFTAPRAPAGDEGTGAEPVAAIGAPDEAAPPAPDAAAVETGPTGTIRGIAKFEGVEPVPVSVTLPMGCAEQHAGPVRTTPVRAHDGRLGDVFVWVREGLEGRSFPPPAGDAVIDQRGCIYEPHVSGVRVGQRVVILNSDPVLHNVRALATKNAPFNEGMPSKDTRLVKKFTKPEVMVRLKCDVHPWMAAFVGVVPHPFFGVTNAAGEFTLEGVPAGKVVLEAWHESFAPRRQEVTVPAGGVADVEFVFR